ncbi:hypothetical protein AAG906_036810 [Vitis piasezkii]
MQICWNKCQHRAPLKVGTLKANKQPQNKLMRSQLYPDINEDEVRQKVTFVKCDASSIGTSDTKCGGETMHIINLEVSPSSVCRRVDNMLSTPFDPHIINYKPSRGFIVPKFTMYDGINDLFDHIMHFRRLMTLNIGNDALLCKSLAKKLPATMDDLFRLVDKYFMLEEIVRAASQQVLVTNRQTKDDQAGSSKPSN